VSQLEARYQIYSSVAPVLDGKDEEKLGLLLALIGGVPVQNE
jgi:DNA replicative helicase MCM subunit Mcm2 (Cdc46/Mcm family)